MTPQMRRKLDQQIQRYRTDPVFRRVRNTRSRIAELKRSARKHEARLLEIDQRIRELIEQL